jgi:PAS domain S-box-containing protein
MPSANPPCHGNSVGAIEFHSKPRRVSWRSPLDFRGLTSIYIDIPALRPGTVGGYAFAILCTLAALMLRLAIDPHVVGAQYIVFFPAVTAATLVSGVRAGFVSTVLSFAAVTFFFLPPRLSFYVANPAEFPALALFVLIMVFEVLVAAGMRRALERYHELSRHLEERVEARTAEALLHSRRLDVAHQRLQQTNDELLAVYDQGLYAAHLDKGGKVFRATRACVEGCGFIPAEVIGKPFWECGWFNKPETRAWVRNGFEQAASGVPFRGEVAYVFKDGTEHTAEIAFIPIRDDGRVAFVFVPGMDVTERVQQYRATFENATVGIAHLNPDLKWRRVNEAVTRITGYSAAELATKTMPEITHPDDVEASLAQVEQAREGKAANYDIEKRHVRKDGTTIWVRAAVSGVRNSDGSIDHFVLVFGDITDSKQAQEKVRLLMREMNHRAKNMLTLVQAIANQTAAHDPERFIERFTERLQALAANQDLLVRNAWRGVNVEDLVRTQLAHFADYLDSRIALRGPRLQLNAAAAQAIGLALHELATNASKYGALSTGDGHVDVDWQIDRGNFAMNWTEREGPPVKPPERRGFGTLVIDSMAQQSINGEVQLNYRPSGLAWSLSCPAENALEATASEFRAAVSG